MIKCLFIFSVPGYKYPPVKANFSRTPLPPNERVGLEDMNPNELRYVSCSKKNYNLHFPYLFLRARAET